MEVTMHKFDWEELLNNDDSLYFFPVSHTTLGGFKIQFGLSGSYELTLSDVIHQGKPLIMFEYYSEDDDEPTAIEFMETNNKIETMIEHLKSIDRVYHEPIYRTVYEWAIELFYK
jgi:hypothetical protein